MDVARVETRQQFDDLCESLQHGQRRVFRGQERHYGRLLPSALRSNALEVGQPMRRLAVELYVNCYGNGDSWTKVAEELQKRLEERYGPPIGALRGWEHSSSFDLSDVYEWSADSPAFPGGLYFNEDPADAALYLEDSVLEKFDEHADAFLQHYQVPTNALDVSWSSEVALWFALMAFERRPSGVTSTSFSPNHPCVYVFPAHEPLVDLRRIIAYPRRVPYERRFPLFGLRGVRQEGALLLGATSAKPDYSGRCELRIEITPLRWDRLEWTRDLPDMTWLFPSRTDDVFLDSLISRREKADAREGLLLVDLIVPEGDEA